MQRSAANCPPLSWTGSVISLFWKQKTDNLRAYVVILDLEYMHICDRQSITLCARQISVYEVLCPTLCLYGCLYGCIFFVYYVCITWACIFVYVCYPLSERVHWYVVLLCYICYTELKKEEKNKNKKTTTNPYWWVIIKLKGIIYRHKLGMNEWVKFYT